MKIQNLIRLRRTKYFKFIIGILLVILASPVFAEEKAKGQYLTKGDAVMLISASDFMKNKISQLLSWTIGYDISRVTRVRLTPTINYIKALPKRVPPDGRTIIEILASVDDPGGVGNISGVRADLSSIGRLSNTMLVDNGLYGDQTAHDGIYTLQTSASPKIKLGAKEVPVAVANKKGWLALAKTTLDIKRNPDIIEVTFVPDKICADGKSIVALSVKVDNPGRAEDLKKVSADLTPIGYGERVFFRNDGQGGDATANDDVFTLLFSVPKTVDAGDYVIVIEAQNISGGYSLKQVSLKVN